MKLTHADCLHRYESNTLKIAFIGMSNIGKSYTARRLKKAYDFDIIEIDALIIEKLGQTSMSEFAQWQGQPYENGYKDREKQSTKLESGAVLSALDMAEGNVILDTPGSVIYTDSHVLERLKMTCLIVYIQTQEHDIERLKLDYFKNPKPLIWGPHFKPKKDYSDFENIMACYPTLLKERAKAYETLADITLTSDFVLNPDVDAKILFNAIVSEI